MQGPLAYRSLVAQEVHQQLVQCQVIPCQVPLVLTLLIPSPAHPKKKKKEVKY